MDGSDRCGQPAIGGIGRAAKISAEWEERNSILNSGRGISWKGNRKNRKNRRGDEKESEDDDDRACIPVNSQSLSQDIHEFNDVDRADQIANEGTKFLAESRLKLYWTFFSTGFHCAKVSSQVMGTLNKLLNGGISFP
jgi:hypothetical protein